MQENTQITAAEQAAYDIGAKGAKPTENEHKLFEAWMRGHCWAVSGTWDGTTYSGSHECGDYIDPQVILTRQLWAAWRDRGALAVPSCLHQIQEPSLAQAAPVAVQDGWRLVPVEFVRGFGTLVHNYSLTAEAPDYYHGVERDAFRAAYERCGRDLAKLRDMLSKPAPAAATVPVAVGEREAFEQDWMRRHHPLPVNTRLRDDGRYGDHTIQGQFEAYQSGRASLAATPADHSEKDLKMAEAEHEALRNVYEQARGVLRHDGIDTQRAIKYRDGLINAIEAVKVIDGGNWEPPEGTPVATQDEQSEYQRGYKHGYNRRDAEVKGALA